MLKIVFILALLASLATSEVAQGDSHRVLVVINDNSSLSKTIGDYYARRRSIPQPNLCHIRASENETIPRDLYNREIAAPIAAFLRRGGFVDQVLYIVTTMGVPLRIEGAANLDGDQASVDSELTLLYSDMKRATPHALKGFVPNPFFGKKDAVFQHPQFPIYLVTRLAAYDFDGVKAMIDRSLLAVNKGKFIIDEKDSGGTGGDEWLHSAAIFLPQDRVVLDQTTTVLYDQTDVIGYASWGSNDPHRHRRFLGFHWLPGAIATEFVSTNGRTFKKPPDSWTPGMDWSVPSGFFANSPQSMTADYILEGATGASGHVFEPYLGLTPRPDLLLPAYYKGRNLAESYYLAIRGLSWQNIVIGDPLCSLAKP
ncbi:MAG: TIGR03790 family protein [Bryobacteraceae bacterium]